MNPKRKRIDWFLLGLPGMVFLAWLVPHPGAYDGWLHASVVNKIGVALIFFLHGAGLPFAAFRSGVLRWPLHLTVQAFTFVFFPLIGWGACLLAGNAVSGDWRTGFFFLCALPSTVSSSVAFTAAARGNVPAAIFNASISSLIGVFLTPFWMSVGMKLGGASLDVGPVIVGLIQWLLLPLVLGQVLRRWLGEWIGRRKPWVNRVDRGVILFLVYTAFCESFVGGIWHAHSWGALAGVFGACAGLLAVVMIFTNWVGLWAKFPEEDRITVFFCGSKKSLAAGVPMAQLIFGSAAGLGVYLLPIMIYHSLQLLVSGVVASRWSRR